MSSTGFLIMARREWLVALGRDEAARPSTARIPTRRIARSSFTDMAVASMLRMRRATIVGDGSHD